MRKTIRIIILVIGLLLVLNGILGMLDIENPIIDFFRDAFPLIFGAD